MLECSREKTLYSWICSWRNEHSRLFSVDWWQVARFSCTFAELGNALAHPMCRRSIPFIQWQPQRLRSTLNLFKYLPSKQSQKQSLRVLSVLRGLLAFYMENFQLFAFKTKPEAKQRAKSLSVRVLSVLRGLLEPLKPIFPFLGLKFWSYFKSIIKVMSKCILRCSPSCSKAFSLQNSITLMLLKPIFCFNRSQIHIYTENFWYSIKNTAPFWYSLAVCLAASKHIVAVCKLWHQM